MRTVAIDLDGTLAQYDGTRTLGGDIGTPVPGMLEVVRCLVKAEARVVVFTVRAETPTGRERVQAWLAKHGFPALTVTATKDPRFSVILDDRAVCFVPAMAEHPADLVELLLTAEPYWKAAP